jgi:hypothetical protein
MRNMGSEEKQVELGATISDRANLKETPGGLSQEDNHERLSDSKESSTVRLTKKEVVARILH